MTDITVRQIRDDELATFLDTLTTGFLERPDVDQLVEELRPLWDLERVWAAFDGGRMCGTFRSWPTELTVPGTARLPASAIAAVTVLPTHRRRGIMRQLVAAEHAALRARGEVAGLLHAAEYPIYGRFGYGPACEEATWTVDARSAQFRGPSSGTVELAAVDTVSRDAIKTVFETWRQRTPGEIRRRDARWDDDLGLHATAWGDRWKGFLAVHRGPAGEVDGYVRYSRTDDRWDDGQPRNAIRVDELHALTDDAYGALWRYLAEMDWVATIKAERRQAHERLPWLLTNARTARLSELADGVWVRLFDVPLAMARRTYEREGDLVLEVIDAESTGGRSRIHLEAGPDGAVCGVTDRAPDLTLDVSALSAAFLGGTSLRASVAALGVDEHRAGALLEADRLLRTTEAPWCSTFF